MKLTDAGLETVLLFDEGIDLPEFAAFPLVDSDDGRAALRRYYRSFLELARDREVPLVLSAPTWRASPDWGRLLGYDGEELAAVNRRALALVEDVRDEVLEPADRDEVVIEACIGSRTSLMHYPRANRAGGSADCARTLPPSATPSSTRPRNSTRAIRTTWPTATSPSETSCPSSRSSEGAAVRTSGT